MDGHRAAYQARAGAPGRHRDVVLIAELHDGCNLFRGVGLHHSLGRGLSVDGHLVVRVVLVDVAAGKYTAGGDGSELLQQLGRQGLIVHILATSCQFIQ